MTELLERSSSESQDGFALDRDTIVSVLGRYPWAVRIVALEAILLSIVLAIPLFFTSDFAHVIFGMVLSLALLIAITSTIVGIAVGVHRALRAIRYRSRVPSRFG
jgi:hypothetical protein